MCDRPEYSCQRVLNQNTYEKQMKIELTYMIDSLEVSRNKIK